MVACKGHIDQHLSHGAGVCRSSSEQSRTIGGKDIYCQPVDGQGVEQRRGRPVLNSYKVDPSNGDCLNKQMVSGRQRDAEPVLIPGAIGAEWIRETLRWREK